jgi:2-polyprenyl-3-methyl-5-hydroxy-6-metoxy-1,4-benzoquinol methylase
MSSVGGRSAFEEALQYHYMNAPTDYFGQARLDVASMVPAAAKLILDVGCGFGGLGRTLLADRNCTVHGIERNPDAATRLEGVYSRYVIADVESSVDWISAERYDCIVFADVLEHLCDPWKTLKRYSGFLRPGGCVVASIPNVRNLKILFDLFVRGRWAYEESGVLDRTHLRFFTRTEIRELFAGAGLEIEYLAVNREHYRPWLRVVALLPALIVPDLTVCQYLVRARPAVPH